MLLLIISTAAATTSSAQRAVGLLGVAVMLLLAYALSYDRRRIDWRLVATGLALQLAFGALVMKTMPGRWCFERLGDLVEALLGFSVVGSRFAFGYLVDDVAPSGISPEAGLPMFAFRMLPIIIFVSSLTSVLYYLGWMQVVVKGIAWVMQRTLRTSGAKTLCASGNIFLGQTEAPLFVRPYLFQFSADLSAATARLSVRSSVIAVYALLGFANFASIGIQIGGLGVLVPERKSDVARLGLRAMVAGNLAAFISASWAGVLL